MRFHRLSLLVGVALLALCAGALSQQPSPRPAKTSQPPKADTSAKEKPVATDQRGTENSPLIVKTIEPAKTQAETARDAKDREDKAATERRLTNYTGLLAIFTLVLAIAASIQVGLFLWQLRLIKDSLRDTKKAADAAKASVDIARENAKIELRAYVCVKGVTITFKTRDAPVANVQITNFGRTPAYNVRAWIHMWIHEHPLKVALPVPPSDLMRANSILAPGNHIYMVMPKKPPVPAESVALLGTKEGTIYIYGRVDYRDVFGKEQWTNYRLIYGGPEPLYGEDLQPDSDGNDAS